MCCPGMTLTLPLGVAVTGYGHNLAIHGAGTMVVEFENRITGISAIPQVRPACHVAQLNATIVMISRHIMPTSYSFPFSFYYVLGVGQYIVLRPVCLTPTSS